MGRKIVKAGELAVGDILASTLSHEVFSIKSIQKRTNPFGETEIVVLGPLSILEKFDANAKVAVLT